jgi:hypothetical protein
LLPRIAGSAPGIDNLFLYLWVYAKASLFILIGTFVLHLCLRGYWVALVGMNSLYPDGILWERLRLGPHAREIARRHHAAMPDKIEAADNRATRVFGVGFGLAMLMLVPLALVLVALAASLLAELAGVHESRLGIVFWLVFASLLLPVLIASALDRRFGAEIAAPSRTGRALRIALGLLGGYGLNNSRNTLIALYSSHEGTARSRSWLIGGLSAVLVLVMLQSVGGSSALRLDDYRGLPGDANGAARSVRAEHYASLRERAPTLDPTPFVPDPIVSGPYLRLFLPYRPRRHVAALRRTCPAALRDDASIDATLDCLATVEPVFLDGRRLRLLLDAASDPVTGQRGMLMMIPVATLSPGRHELKIWAPAESGRATAQSSYLIPFWK